MSLHDLHAVFVSTQNACKSIDACGNLSLSKEFKELYASKIKDEPSFSRHNEAIWLANDILELHSRGNRTVTYIPSVFFFVAEKLVPLYLELQAYRAALVQVLQQYNHTLDDTEEPSCVQYINNVAFLSDEEKHWLCKFVTDGGWWGKGRQIKRAQDFYESPLMQSASLTQETQSEVARITKQFAENPMLVSKLAVTKNSFAEESSNADRLTVALKLFQEARKATVSTDVRYWIFSPGEQACRWDEMRDGGAMALSYEECGRDLREYADEEAIRAEFKSSEEDEASYKNHVRALTDFLNVMKPGDFVFAKKGTKIFLGVGRVTGEYEFVADATDYKHRRAVEWLKAETVEREDAVARKTLTDVTRYGDLVRELCEAYGIEEGEATNANATDWGCQDVRDWFDAYTPEKLKDDFAYFRSRMLWSKRVQGTIGREYAYIDELAAVMKELKESPRPIGYYASEEFANKCPDGFGKSTATDFLMKFHPNEYISFTGNMMDALDFLGLWPKDVKRDMEVCYNELIGAATRVRNRMNDLEIGRFAEGKKPEADYLTVNEFLWWANEHKDLIKEKVMESKYKPTEIKKVPQAKIDDFSEFIEQLEKDVSAAGLKYAQNLLKRFVCAQLAKPFVVLTGLSGSGKTKLAQAFTKWIAVENTAKIVPIGADWTNSEKLLGYPNALDKGEYVLPDTGVLRFILDASLPENQDLPFFLILDEMNLSHVERYFADFLSAMESGDEIKLYDGELRYSSDGMKVPKKLTFPKNLFIIGTMNVDETTYMFSPKVLDRAQVIEFRVSADEMKGFLENPSNPNMVSLLGKGAQFSGVFLEFAGKRAEVKSTETAIPAALNSFFKELSALGAEFGYRSASEILSFCGYYLDSGAKIDEAIDAAIVQKLLPKVHGSRRKLVEYLKAMWKLCLKDGKTSTLEGLFAPNSTLTVEGEAKYQLSAEKIGSSCMTVGVRSLHNLI